MTHPRFKKIFTSLLDSPEFDAQNPYIPYVFKEIYGFLKVISS